MHCPTHNARPKASEVLFFRNVDLPFDPQMKLTQRMADRIGISRAQGRPVAKVTSGYGLGWDRVDWARSTV